MRIDLAAAGTSQNVAREVVDCNLSWTCEVLRAGVGVNVGLRLSLLAFLKLRSAQGIKVTRRVSEGQFKIDFPSLTRRVTSKIAQLPRLRVGLPQNSRSYLAYASGCDWRFTFA